MVRYNLEHSRKGLGVLFIFLYMSICFILIVIPNLPKKIKNPNIIDNPCFDDWVRITNGNNAIDPLCEKTFLKNNEPLFITIKGNKYDIPQGGRVSMMLIASILLIPLFLFGLYDFIKELLPKKSLKRIDISKLPRIETILNEAKRLNMKKCVEYINQNFFI